MVNSALKCPVISARSAKLDFPRAVFNTVTLFAVAASLQTAYNECKVFEDLECFDFLQT
jgi:hypothetical protein